MLVRCDDVRIIPEATTDKELVDFLRNKLAVTPALCGIRDVSQTDV